MTSDQRTALLTHALNQLEQAMLDLHAALYNSEPQQAGGHVLLVGSNPLGWTVAHKGGLFTANLKEEPGI